MEQMQCFRCGHTEDMELEDYRMCFSCSEIAMLTQTEAFDMLNKLYLEGSFSLEDDEDFEWLES
jgi:hypothetical protein